MDNEHLQPSKEGLTEIFLLAEAKAGWSVSKLLELLQEHDREYPLPGLHSVVWKLHCEEQEGAVQAGQNLLKDCESFSPDL